MSSYPVRIRPPALRSLIVVMATLLSLIGGLALSAPPAHAASRSQIVAVAAAEVGASEANGSCLKYGPCTTQEWCAYFARWVWNNAGVSPVFTTAVARGVGLWGVNNGLFSPRPAGGIGSPLPGDIVVYGSPANQTGGHVSIVASINGNGTIDTIDGNWNERVQRRTINPVSAVAGEDNLPISGYVRPPGTSSGGNDVSDFSGDGYSDVLGVESDGKLYYYPNNGINLGARTQLGSGGWEDFKFAVAADWSGDGHADVLGVDSFGQLFYYPNTNNSLSTRAPIGSGGWKDFLHFMAADWSGDGYADVLGVDSIGRLWYYPHNGAGLGAAVQIGDGWQNFRQVMAADFSGDGYADVLGVDSDGQLWYYPHSGNVLGPRIKLGSGGWEDFKFVRAMDFSGDGHADVLGVDSFGQLFYYPNTNNTLSTRTPIGSGGWLRFKFIL